MSSKTESNTPQKKRGPRIQSGWGSSNPAPKSSTLPSTTTNNTLNPTQNPLVEENKPIFITSTKEKEKEVENEKFTVYQDGLVLIKKCIPLEIQQKLANDCIAIGIGDVAGIPSFYDGKTTTVAINKDAGYAHISYEEDKSDETNAANDGNSNKQLNMLNKARVVINSDQLPTDWLQLCDEYLKMAIHLSPTIPYVVPKMCSLNYYTNNARIGWHTDKVIGLDMKDQNKITSPIISFSVGNSCEFWYRNKLDQDAKVIILESGDVLVFGGPSRMILHTVPKIIKHTCPLGLNMGPFTGRFNLTFREHNA